MSKSLYAAFCLSMTATGVMGGFAGGLVLASTGVVRIGAGRDLAAAVQSAANVPALPAYQPGYAAAQAMPPDPATRGTPLATPRPGAAASPIPAAPAAPAALPDPLQNPEIAGRILASIAGLDGIAMGDGRGEVPAERMVQVFFDPRCPYCHKAFTDLAGAVPARWIPVVALGDEAGGEAQAAAILAAAGGPSENGASAGAKALRDAFDRQLAGAVATDDVKQKLRQNLEAFVAINSREPQKIGVPTILVPRADGTVSMRVGFDAAKGDARDRRRVRRSPVTAARLGAFGFPPSPSPVPPGRMGSRIAWRQGAAVFLASALTGSVLCNLSLGLWMLGKADARAYATDGSLYGCELRESSTPPADATEAGE